MEEIIAKPIHVNVYVHFYKTNSILNIVLLIPETLIYLIYL